MSETRICSMCGVEKLNSTEFFYARSKAIGGLASQCKVCVCAKQKARLSDPSVAEEKRVARRLRYERITKPDHKSNPEKYAAAAAKWRKRNPEASRASQRRADAKRRNDPVHALNKRMRCGIRKALCGSKNGRSWESIVGYNVDKLRQHIERQFTKGMSWEAYRAGLIHLDHIRPQSSFLPTDEEFQDCWAITNLRPLWAAENLKKKAKRIFLL